MIKITKNILIQALDCGANGTVIVEAGRRGLPIVYVNPVIESLTGFDPSSLVGRRLKDLVAGGELPRYPWERSQRIAQKWTGKDGRIVDLEFRVSPLYNRPGAPSFLLLTECSETALTEPACADSTDALKIALKDARLRLQHMERADSVTGLMNHRAFIEILRRDWAIARREERPVSVILFEIDDFDDYAQLFGRHASDSCIRKVAHAINGSARRDSDVIARYSHCRFVALVGSAAENQVADFAARIAAKVRDLSIHHPRSSIDRFVTVSFGVASLLPAKSVSSEALLENAEAQLLAAREATIQQNDQAI